MTTPQRSLLVVGALLALCAVAALAMVGGGATGPLGAASLGAAPAAAPEVEDETAAAGARRAADAAGELPTRERVDLAAAGLAAGGETLALQVVDARSGAPVPGAEVGFLESPGRGGREEIARDLPRIEREGGRAVADENGVALLPQPRRELAVFGRSGDLFGVARIRNGDDDARLVLEVDETLTVRVVGPDRRPRAGIELALAADRIRELDRRSTATSDDSGIAVFEHVQLYRSAMPQLDQQVLVDAAALSNQAAILEQVSNVQRLRSNQVGVEIRVELRNVENQLREVEREVWRELRRRRDENQPEGPPQWADFVVAARVPQATPQVLRIRADAVPRDPLELAIGTVGAVDVRVVGPDGRPLWVPCRIVASVSAANPLPATVEPTTFDRLRGLTARSIERDTAAGAARIAPLGAGALLDFAVRFADDDFNFDVAGIAGPVADEVRTVELRAPDWLTVLAGRLVDVDGAPVAGLRAELLLSGATGRIEGEPLTTDAEGRFELPLRLRTASPPYHLEIQAERAATPTGALVAVPDIRAGGRNDLGDIAIAALPALLTGTVADDRGTPIERARVQLQVFHPAIGEAGDWRDVAYVAAETGADGTWRLFGEPRRERMRVAVQARGHIRAWSPELAMGAEYAARLDRVGTLELAGFAPQWLPRRAVRMELRRDGRSVRRQDFRVRRDESFREEFGGLEPGVYDLVVELEGFGSLHRIDGAVVAPGDRVRVAPVDLRDRLFRYEVRVVDGAGQPVGDPGSPLLAQVARPDGSADWAAFGWRGDRVEFIASRPATDVVLLATGHRPVRASIGAGESLLTLRAMQPVELELPGLRRMVGDGRVRVSLVHTGDTGLPMNDLRAVDQGGGRGRNYSRAALGKSGGAWLGDGDTVAVPLMLDGEYRVVVRLHAAEGRKVVSREIGTVRVQLDPSRPARAAVTPPPAVIQEALVELGA